MERAQLVKDSESERAEIRRQWQKLKDEVSRMEEMHKLQNVRLSFIMSLLGPGRSVSPKYCPALARSVLLCNLT